MSPVWHARCVTWLPRAGVLPFLLALSALALGQQALPVLGPVLPIVLGYGVVIAAFMSGALWGQVVMEPAAAIWLLFSNLLALVTWAAAVWLSPQAALPVLAGVFVALWLADRQRWRAGRVSSRYWRIRCEVTALVVPAVLGCSALA